VITDGYAGFPTAKLLQTRMRHSRVQHLMHFSNRNDCTSCVASEYPFGSDTDSHDEDPVVSQQGRALALWDTVCRELNVPEDVMKTVTERLEQGLVPPVFHAYSALFKTMGGTKKLQQDELASTKQNEMIAQVLGSLPSMNRVKEGSAVASQTGQVGDTDFMDAFFTKKGLARKGVQDANNLVWTFSPRWTKEVCHLINAEAEMIGADVEITQVDSDFRVGTVRSASATHLITRRLSRGVVAECLGMFAEDIFAIVGCPGIGKSWALIYALQQLLLQDGACVLFFAAKDKMALACIRRDDKVYVWSLRTATFISDLFEFENVWVLVDPVEATQGSTEIVTGRRRLLFAASNHEKHFASDMRKRNPAALHYLDPYDEDELRVALPVMTSAKVFDERVLDWASEIGMLPRYLISEDHFKARSSLFDDAVTMLTRNDIKELANSRGFSNSRTSLPESVFVVRAARDVDEDSDNNIPIGYDGESGVIYTKRSISMMTEYIWKAVTNGDRESMILLWGSVDFWPWKEQ
jgi:hypothetical protein